MSNRMNDIIIYNAADAEIDGVYAEISEAEITAAFLNRHELDEMFDGYRYLTPRAYVAAEIKRLRGIRRRIANFADGMVLVYREDGIWKEVAA